MHGRRAAAALVAASVMAAAACAGRHGPGPASDHPRLHHVHVRVPEPSRAMDALARGHGCEKVILPAIGVGVRCGDAYVIFERGATGQVGASTPALVSVTGSGQTAELHVVIAATDPETTRAWIATTFGDAVAGRVTLEDPWRLERRQGSLQELVHLAVGLPDVPAQPFLTAPGGLVIEQVRDEGRGPDAFWCPMHPDVRSPSAGTCPLCGMPLVAMAEARARDYRLDVDFQPARRLGGRLRLAIRDADTGERITSFVTVHDRLLHLFVISRTLDVFEHIHPALQPDGRFAIDLALPRDDAYMLVADVHPAGGAPGLLQSLWVTPGHRGSPFPDGSDLRADSSSKTGASVRIALTTTSIAAGRDEPIAFAVTDTRTGDPVADLQPYLGAPGHLVIVSRDLGDVIHSHPADVTSAGPDVAFEATFPRPGLYKMWVQVQRRGVVETASFVVDVR